MEGLHRRQHGTHLFKALRGNRLGQQVGHIFIDLVIVMTRRYPKRNTSKVGGLIRAAGSKGTTTEIIKGGGGEGQIRICLGHDPAQ